jgi:hypothetical protein
MRVLVKGPVLTRTGYGEHARFVLRSLREVENIELFVTPTQWGRSGWVWEDSEERTWIDGLVGKTAVHTHQQGTYDVSIQVGIPNEWDRLAPVNIGVTAGIETTKVAPVWLERANLMNKVITISTHSKRVFKETEYHGTHQQTGQQMTLKCTAPIDVVHYPVKNHKKVDLDLDVTTPFNFLTIAQWGPRKNIENTIQWFVEEFIDNPEVGLVVKTFAKGGSLMDRQMARNTLSKLLENYSHRQCKIYLLHGDLSEKEIHSLYKCPKIKAYVSLAHGEGFGLPHFEAAYSGLPVVAPEWSGYLDFLCMPKKDKKGNEKIKPHFVTVDYDMQPIAPEAVWDGVLEKESMWCYAQQGSYKMRLREVYKDYGRFQKQAKVLKKWIEVNFDEKGQLEKLREAIVSTFPSHNSPELDAEIDELFEKLAAEA